MGPINNIKDINGFKDNSIQSHKTDKARNNYFVDTNMSRSQKSKDGSRKSYKTDPNDLSLNISTDKKKNIIFFKKTNNNKDPH